MEAPLSCCNARIGFFGVAALVLLRITVGWHILYEGLWKHEQEEFSADNFLAQSSGPFAEYYHQKVMKDFEWRKHFDKEWNFDQLDRYYSRFMNQTSLDADAVSIADRAIAARKANIATSLDAPENRKLIDDYFKQWDALHAKRELLKVGKGDTSFDQQRLWEAEQKLRNEARPWLVPLQAQHDGFRDDLNRLLPLTERDKKIRHTWSELFRDNDLIVTYSNIAIGFCLILGLFSRFAAFGGAVFLGLIVGATWQWPGYYSPPTHPAQGHSLFVTKEFVEMMALVVLAAIPTGRWGGLDYFIHNAFVRPFLVEKD